MEKWKERIENIVAFFAYGDYLRANRKKNGKFYKTYRPYTLSYDTNEAREIRDSQNEEIIKGYILKFRTRFPELYIDDKNKMVRYYK